ncbi:MazG nucleotide pyrophosphohydrolase domain-containing protein [Peptacetobacter hiranonis]|uniref:NTP pyrophosphohydrolase MazG-like domain-containing protein n=1 Tax=Peptacetobacter hiranonis (strain DSM 13275 / JCM 10541 / KCTC 15199 / TO-931) TaxID=500633 RepID=B6FZY6_PEPHT|nr:MazG nucleotide pyrophosphohydrolase domain-containing protein [Peptacetobacter hiranonis]EEA84959.1 hypothetical protein CLOHIR_01440 [Peptacetobacter hiranonis DSM 13275]QEK20779.1 hypothetical protein KGNDJEFE_01266 [Peptacetobacter hiranonis]
MKHIVKTLNKHDAIIDETKGYDNTIQNILFEELGELIQAISKMNRSKIHLKNLGIKRALETQKVKRENITPKIENVKKLINEKFEPNLAEEMADVIICLCWIAKIYEVKEDKIVYWLNKKCERMDRRIKEGDFY